MSPVERKIVRSIVEQAMLAGWIPHQIDDGGDFVTVRTSSIPSVAAMQRKVLDVVESVHESRIFFRREDNNRRAWALIIPGNGRDCLSDYSAIPGFDEAMEKVVGQE